MNEERTNSGEESGNGIEAEPNGLVAAARRFIEPLITTWMGFVRAFSWVVARVVAIVLFVVGFIPYSIVMRLVGYDPLDRESDLDTDSYWSDAEATNKGIEKFRKQY